MKSSILTSVHLSCALHCSLIQPALLCERLNCTSVLYTDGYLHHNICELCIKYVRHICGFFGSRKAYPVRQESLRRCTASSSSAPTSLESEGAPTHPMGQPRAPSPQATESEELQTYRSLRAAGPGLESNTHIQSLWFTFFFLCNMHCTTIDTLFEIKCE